MLTTAVNVSAGGSGEGGDTLKAGLAEIVPIARIQIEIMLKILDDFIMDNILSKLESMISKNLSLTRGKLSYFQ